MMYDYKLHLVIRPPRACLWEQSAFYAGGMNLVFLNWYHFEFRDDRNVFEKNIDEMIVHDYPIEIFHNRKKKPITE